MQEFNDVGGEGEVDYAEHSKFAKSKKVIPGPTDFAPHASDPTTAAPVQGTVAGSSASLALVIGKAYRVISSAACYFKLSVGAETAVVGDIYLPADTPITIKAQPWDTLSFIQVAAGGIIQAAEVR